MKTLIASLGTVFCALILIATIGCDTESADAQRVYISPAQAKVELNDTVVFTASEGYEYEWTLLNPSLGSISAHTGEQVVYTSLTDSSSSNYVAEIQVLAVTSIIPGSGTSGTNTTDNPVRAEAYITHQ
jgi:hypothetical protein